MLCQSNKIMSQGAIFVALSEQQRNVSLSPPPPEVCLLVKETKGGGPLYKYPRARGVNVRAHILSRVRSLTRRASLHGSL